MLRRQGRLLLLHRHSHATARGVPASRASRASAPTSAATATARRGVASHPDGAASGRTQLLLLLSQVAHSRAAGTTTAVRLLLLRELWVLLHAHSATELLLVLKGMLLVVGELVRAVVCASTVPLRLHLAAAAVGTALAARHIPAPGTCKARPGAELWVGLLLLLLERRRWRHAGDRRCLLVKLLILLVLRLVLRKPRCEWVSGSSWRLEVDALTTRRTQA